ncbi:M20 family metallopeptidase [Halalkalirubrum salinum]|uniref:M20 family metallopeptidase n=1 Tax=Halalkalirubrum salinum TaxID=2563889 RepID=UPI0010FAD55F|nr:M20 family metallopeptidase [Halalkalirubrum salinum]
MAAAASGFDPVEFLEQAVQIDSTADVTTMRSFLLETIERHGVAATVDSAGNTIATKRSDRPDDGPHLVLNTHIDTVRPHVPYERDDRIIRGRGSCDAKGPLAALLTAFFSVDPDRGRVTLAVSPDEETLSTGAAALTGKLDHQDVDPIDGDCYIVGEPTGLDVCTAAKGRFQGQLMLSGVSAHAAEPKSGVNAIAALEAALAAIRSFDEGRSPHPQLGSATLTPTVVDGGESTNQVPAQCTLTLDRRSIPPETQEEFRAAIESAVREAVPSAVGVSFDLTDRPSPFLGPFSTDPGHQLVRTLADATAEQTDCAAGDVRPFTAATEASYFAPAPTVVFGPGVLADKSGAVAHSDREYVPVAAVKTAATALSTAVDRFIS